MITVSLAMLGALSACLLVDAASVRAMAPPASPFETALFEAYLS